MIFKWRLAGAENCLSDGDILGDFLISYDDFWI
jgi:hypothetical protein